jgi:FkbM family methyltransferase
MSPKDSAELTSAFCHRFALNRKGGWPARMARLQVMHWLIAQRLGRQHWVRAPLFFGESMWVLTGETISGGLLSFGYSETALTALMLRVLRPGMRFVDVGAHLGYEALLACALVGESGRVVSYEPQAGIARYTARNLKPFPQAKLLVSAVADYKGELAFDELPLARSAFSGTAAGMSGSRRITVAVTTLDDGLLGDARPVDFIKVDVEGGEMAVLRGAMDVLERDRPCIVLEAEMPSGSAPRSRVREFSEFLQPLGYRGISFDFDGELRLAPLGGLAEGHANVAFVPAEHPDFQLLERA